jgi:hypothetical protein
MAKKATVVKKETVPFPFGKQVTKVSKKTFKKKPKK